MKKVKEPVTHKVCRKCGRDLPIEKFRPRVSGFILNQCRECEGAMNKARAIAKKAAVSPFISVTTKSGKVVQASTTPIVGGRMTTSPNTDKVLYFSPDVNRDTARVAFSAYANISRTGINYKTV